MAVDKALFTPIKSKRTFEEVSSKIKGLIFDGTLKPGDRLPSEADLAGQFNVGRQTIREALRILELSGFVTIQKGYGGGPIIKDTVVSKISTLFLDAFQLEKITLEQITQARSTIEPAILNHILENIDDSDIEALQENLRKTEEKIKNKMMCTEENMEFHTLLAKASKNPVFVIVIESIATLIRDMHGRMPPDPQTCKQAYKRHKSILDAIINKDIKAGIKLLESHFLEVQNRLKK